MKVSLRVTFFTLVLGFLGGSPEVLAAGKKGGKGVRERVITREASLKSKDQKQLDFEEVDISGQRKSPMGTLINQNKSEKEYDFVKIRTRWHPEMVQSASSLENGKSK